MKFLGIDYGTKRIGLAISDENGTLAFPKEIVLNDANTLARLGEIIKQENIKEIVMGESVDFSGKLNALSARIEVFILELQEKFGLQIHKQNVELHSILYYKPHRLHIFQQFLTSFLQIFSSILTYSECLFH